MKKILLLPLRCVLFLFSFVFLYLATNNTFNELSKWWPSICVFCNIITILILLLICRKNKVRYSESINCNKGKTKIKTVIITILAMIVVGAGGMYIAGFICYNELTYIPEIMIQPIPLWVAIVNVLVLPLTTTLAEDGLYLGVLNQTSGTSAFVLTVFFYAIQHSFLPFVPEFEFMAYRFLMFLPPIIMICLLYRKSKDPLPFMIGHFILNFATAIQIIMISA